MCIGHNVCPHYNSVQLVLYRKVSVFDSAGPQHIGYHGMPLY